MAEYLKMCFITKNQFVVCGLVMLTLSAQAEALRDPTMPPAQLLQKAGTVTESYNAPVLQSTRLGEQNKTVMINGEIVTLGQQYHGAKLIKVTENTAVLKGADGKQQVLSMNYPIERKWLVSEPSLSPLSKHKPSNQTLSEKHDE